VIAISVSAGAKRQNPIEQYASINSQVSLSGEAGTLADVAPVMRDLLAAAQAGCDQHLAEQIALLTGGTAQPQQRPAPQPQSSVQSRQPSRSPSQARPAPRRGGIPLASDAQRRLLDRLLSGDPQQTDAICDRAGVATIGALNMKQASEAIDWLKAQAAPA
jgi:hypothetical protein